MGWIVDAYGAVKDWIQDNDFLSGGDATKSIPGRPENMTYATGYAKDQLGALAQRNAPMSNAASLDNTYQLGARNQMQGLADRLGMMATGQQAGAGELGVNRQVSQATAAQQAAARMARGANAALAMRNAARNTADIGLAGAGQAAQAQMLDQQGANAQLGGLLSGMRGQDIGVASQNAGFQQQANLANQNAQLQQTGMNDQMKLGLLANMLGWDQAALAAALGKAGIAASDKGIMPGLLQGLASAAAQKAASDERLKTDVRDARSEVDEMMATLKPVSYRYKDEDKWGAGDRLGILAQDLQRSELGKTAVVPVDDSGHIGFDVGMATSMSLAGLARLHERVSKLEGR
jgi:hypothetical protein